MAKISNFEQERKKPVPCPICGSQETVIVWQVSSLCGPLERWLYCYACGAKVKIERKEVVTHG